MTTSSASALTVPTGQRKTFVKEPRASYTAFIGGAADKTSDFGQGPTNIIGDVESAFRKAVEKQATGPTLLQKGTCNTGYFGWAETDEGVVDKEIERRRAEDPSLFLQIVGHSYGGDSAVGIAKRLGKTQKIDVLITLDPVGTRHRLVRPVPTGRVGTHIIEPRPDGITFWLNVWARPARWNLLEWTKDDWIANLGTQWDDEIKDKIDIFYELALHHAEAKMMLTSADPTGKLGKSPWDLLLSNTQLP